MLKPVPKDKKKSLGKLPTKVRNKMGFMKKGGRVKKKKIMKKIKALYNKVVDKIFGKRCKCSNTEEIKLRSFITKCIDCGKVLNNG